MEEKIVEQQDNNVENLFEEMENLEQNVSVPVEEVSEPVQEKGYESVFSSLQNDVAGANNFIANLLEQRKSYNLSEAALKEDREKFAKEKEDFEKYQEVQKENIRQEKERLEEFEKNQKLRMQNEEKQFAAEVDATRKEMEIANQGLNIARENFEKEQVQFAKRTHAGIFNRHGSHHFIT